MSDNNTKYSRLTIDNRLKIEECLNEDKKLKDIANEIGCSPRTISYEIYNHRYLSTRKRHNMCTMFKEYNVQHLCNDCKRGYCKHCTYHKCNDMCYKFQLSPECKISNVRLFKDSLVKIIGDIFDSYDSLINLFGGQCQII